MIPPFDDEIEQLRLRAARLEQELRSLHGDIDRLRLARAIAPADEPGTTPTEQPPVRLAAEPPIPEHSSAERAPAPPATPPLAPSLGPAHTPPTAYPVSREAKRGALHRLFDEREDELAIGPGEPSAPPPPGMSPEPAAPPAPGLLHAARSSLEAALVALSLKRPADEERAEDPGLEMRIGGVWFNRIGALILLIGAAFLFKLSVDRGWLSPAMRVGAIALLGLGLIAAGELALRKAMRVFAVGMLGGGIALLYLSAFGAHKFYGLIDQTPASIGYMAITAASAIIAVHARMLPVAVLGLLGGLATPILLSRGDNKQVELLTYLLALDAAFLIVGSIRRWDVMRLLAWLGTVALFGGWAVTYYPTHVAADAAATLLHPVAWRTALFATAFYLLFHAEAVVSLRLGRALHGRLVAGVTGLNYAAFFATVYFTLRTVVPDWMGLFAVAAAALQWVTAWRLLGGSTLARYTRRSLWLGGAGMLALAAPMQFDRYLVSVSWSVQGVVTLAFARRFAGELWIRIKGAALPIAALAHLVIFEYRDPAMRERFAEFGQWYANGLLLCFVGSALCCYAGGILLVARRTASQADQKASTLLVALGTVSLLAIFANQWERFIASWWWIALAAIWCAAGLRWRPAAMMGALLAVAVAAKFVLYDTTVFALEGQWDAISGLVANRAVVTGVAATALILLALPGAKRAAADEPADPMARWLPALTPLAAVLVTWTGTFEILRAFAFEPTVLARFAEPHAARGIFITGLWAIIALALWGLPARFRSRALPGVALTLATLALARYLLLDTVAFASQNHWRHLAGVLVNRQFLVGLIVVGAVAVSWRRLSCSPDPRAQRAAAVALIAAMTAFVWAASFEVLRSVHFESWVRSMFDAPRSAGGICLTGLWALLAAALWLLPHARRLPLVEPFALILGGLAVLRLLLIDTMAFAAQGYWSALRGVAVNRQFLGGLLVIALGFLMHRRLWTAAASGQPAPCRARRIVVAVLLATLLTITWVPTFEIARIFRFERVGIGFGNPRLAMHMTLSVFWGLNAAALLVAGFARRSAVVRYAGLTLFAVTVVKVFLVDMSSLDMAYRIVSFMVVGVLLLAASLLYQRLAARIVGRTAP